jgi:hypothetical protein
MYVFQEAARGGRILCRLFCLTATAFIHISASDSLFYSVAFHCPFVLVTAATRSKEFLFYFYLPVVRKKARVSRLATFYVPWFWFGLLGRPCDCECVGEREKMIGFAVRGSEDRGDTGYFSGAFPAVCLPLQ